MMSEQLEVLLTASRTDYVGIAPHSLLALANKSFALEALPACPEAPAIPVNMIWHHSRHADPAHTYLREQLIVAVRQLKEAHDLS